MPIGEIDHLRVVQRPLGHDGAVPVRVVVDEAAGSVTVRLGDRDVVHVAAVGADLVGDRGHLQAVGQADDRSNQGHVVRPGGDPVHETLVDLNGMDRQIFKVT